MKTNNLSFAIICATIILFAFIFWPTLYRYDKISKGSYSYPIRTNRVTGYTEYFFENEWIPQQIEKKISILPTDEQNKVTGNAGLDNYGSFSGKIYNGSNWSITEIVVRVCTKEIDGAVRWDRNFKESIVINPLSTSDLNIKVAGYENVPTYEWNIVEVRGFKEKE